MPKAIADESQFVQTIDFQLESIKLYYGDTVKKALSVQAAAMTEVPGGQPLALPEPVWQTITDINTYLQDVRSNAQKLTTQDKTLQALS